MDSTETAHKDAANCETVSQSSDDNESCSTTVGLFDGIGPRCGRPFYSFDANNQPVCLMHSDDPNKQSGPLFETFWQEFEQILEDAGEGEACFNHFIFPELDFRPEIKTFRAACSFVNAIFKEKADFSCAVFLQRAIFLGAKFEKGASFDLAEFSQSANFRAATFDQRAEFIETSFQEEASFREAKFKEADFYVATFSRPVSFEDTEFLGTADWRRSRFLDQAEFRRTKFNPRIAGAPGAVFALAEFAKPGEIVFDEVDLGRVLFHKCDVSQLCFGSVTWGERTNKCGKSVFDETVSLERLTESGPRMDEQRRCAAVAQIYQHLKKNYDSRLDHSTADEFYFGEMEMKRLAAPMDGPILWLRRWLLPRFSLVALYRYASDCGNSYWKPMLGLFGVLALFAILFPLPGIGLNQQGGNHIENYTTTWRTADGWGPNLSAEIRLAGKSAITSIDSAIQRSAEYPPAYPWGRVLAVLETLLTSILFALVLLAIRRQFRR